MAKKTGSTSESRPQSKQPVNKNRGPFKGANTKAVAVPSGTPLKFDTDECAILKFIGTKDVTDLVEKRGDNDRRAIYLVFNDGRQIVSISQGFKFSTVEWERDHYYWIHCIGEVETELNPMRDYQIDDVGVEGDTVEVEPWMSKSGKLSLDEETIGNLNYDGPINYPLK